MAGKVVQMKKYNWATLGCGVIANELAVAMEKKGEKLYSVANRTHKKAVQFAEKYGIEKVYDNIDQVFEDALRCRSQVLPGRTFRRKKSLTKGRSHFNNKKIAF